MRVAALDCGTNSIRMLIADGGPGGLRDVSRRLELVRLGQGVDATRRFHPDALRRTFTALDRFAAEIAETGVDHIRFVATSATRDVTNRDEFFAGVRERLGVEPEVINGIEEARLSFVGALEGRNDLPQPVLVTDIGGGSTELILGRDAELERAASLDVGAVRLTERFLHSDPPTAVEVARARAYVEERIAACGLDLAGARSWVGVAGTLTTMAAISLKLSVYDPRLVDGTRLDLEEVKGLSEFFLRSATEELVQIPTLPRMRAEVIAGGAVIARSIADVIGAPHLLVSESDILDGLAASVFRHMKALGWAQ